MTGGTTFGGRSPQPPTSLGHPIRPEAPRLNRASAEVAQRNGFATLRPRTGQGFRSCEAGLSYFLLFRVS